MFHAFLNTIHYSGVVVEQTDAHYNWLIPLMYGISVMITLITVVIIALWMDDVDVNGIWPLALIVVTIGAFVGTGVLHSNLEKVNGYDRIAEDLTKEYGVKFDSAELNENNIRGLLNENTVSEVKLQDMQRSMLSRNPDTGAFERGPEKKYALVIDGRVIELVEMTTEDNKEIFIPVEPVVKN